MRKLSRELAFTLKTLTLVLALTSVAHAQSGADREAIRRAVLDYVEGVYEVDADRIKRSVHPELAKRGFYIKRGESAYSEEPMTFAQLVELAGTYNRNGRIPAGAPKEVIILDALNQTASVKLIASWGIDYMHLGKYDGRWMIVNILWQSRPPSPTRAASER